MRGKKMESQTQNNHTVSVLQLRWAYNKLVGLNNQIHIKYKTERGIVEMAAPQQTLHTHREWKVGYSI